MIVLFLAPASTQRSIAMHMHWSGDTNGLITAIPHVTEDLLCKKALPPHLCPLASV